MNGILLVDKEKDMTSRDVVNEISKTFHTKKVGHTGTLDPLATGVLVVCLGNYTKLTSLLTSMEKEYIATMKLGILTDTLDITGKVLKEEKVKISSEEIKEVFANFPKKYLQEVPLYSAVKVNGKKLYEYARENIEVTLPKKEVLIKELEIINIQDDTITFKALVSKGTYIRSLINDLASKLNTVGVMTNLKRIKQGKFKIEDCHKLKDINEKMLITIDKIFNYPVININEEQLKKVINGNMLKLNCQNEFVFVSFHNEKKAIYQKDKDLYKIIFKI